MVGLARNGEGLPFPSEGQKAAASPGKSIGNLATLVGVL